MKKRSLLLLLLISIAVLWFIFCLPDPLFNDPVSTVVESEDGQLLSAKIADDGQWRFPASDSVPDRFVNSIRMFEDENFFNHPGVNPLSFFRAVWQNLKAGKVVSGGSTLTMQTIRLSRKGQKRTVFEKAIEIIYALRLEFSYNKNEILGLYAAHAPFGGNVVGLEAAAWRYYGRSAVNLSWGETATLAVLPNAPSLIYPGKNHDALKLKRDRLLNKLMTRCIIDSVTCELAKSEPLPGKPYPVPRYAPHLLERFVLTGGKGKRIRSTINYELQSRVNKIVDDYHSVLHQNEIHNMAVLVLDVENNSVITYVGNTNCSDEGSGRDVDIITSPRSSGSILKPFLFTFMLQDGALLPDMLVTDIPTRLGDYSPKNFDDTFDGVVPAGEALARSLNVPAVRMLQNYGLEKFHFNLKKLNFTTINMPVNHYGLSIILGGAEVTLWDLGKEYLHMARTLKRFKNIRQPILNKSQNKTDSLEFIPDVFSPGAVWLTFQALSTLNRPVQESGWEEFQSSQKIAWKTGTSFGHRDAWAVGVTSKYVVAVWTGNADGEGRPGLTGVNVAAPVLFKVFKFLKKEKWFDEPSYFLDSIEVCSKSGYPASEICEEKMLVLKPSVNISLPACPYHEVIHLDKTGTKRVNSECYPVYDMKNVSWFVLSPVQEYYYKRKNPFYQPLPSYREDCQFTSIKNMEVIYPRNYTRIFIPRGLTGDYEKVIFEVAHRKNNSEVFWHLDNTYIGKTAGSHEKEIHPVPGKHRMTLVDENGEILSWNFEIIEK